MTENLTRDEMIEFAPVTVDNAADVSAIQKDRVNRELLEIVRIFNKITGKFDMDTAINVLLMNDFKQDETFDVVEKVIHQTFDNNFEFQRTDGIVARLQIILRERGIDKIDWS